MSEFDSPVFTNLVQMVTAPRVVCPTCGLPPDEAGPDGFRCRRGHFWQRGEGRTVVQGNGREPVTAPEEPEWLRDAPHPAGELLSSKPHLAPIYTSVQGEVGAGLRERNAAELRREAAERGDTSLPFLSFLGQGGYMVRGWSHIVAGYPKAGKTELIARLCLEWRSESIAYFTEEPESVWEARLAALPDGWSHVNLIFALGARPEAILARIQSGNETVVIIDTVRNLLSLRDETDNSEVARVLNPVIATCREGGKTLLLAHHLRKGGGEHGEAITGGHAFLGVVDLALEIAFDNPNAPNRRKVRGWGRVIAVPELVYEMRDDKSFAPLGAPEAVALGEVKSRVLETLNGEWQALREIHDALDEPKPSKRQLQYALDALTDAGQIERDPPQKRPGKTGKYRLPTSPCTGLPIVQGEVESEEADL